MLNDYSRTKTYKLILLTFLSALLFSLSIPNDFFIYGNPIIGLICLIPLYFSIKQCSSFRIAVILGIIFGSVSTVFIYYWLLFFKEFSIWTLPSVTLLFTLEHMLLIPYLFGAIRLKPKYRLFVFAGLWTFYEFFKSYGFLGNPWALLAHPFHSISPLIQIADITGVWGVTFIVVLVNALLSEWLMIIPNLKQQIKFKHIINQSVFVIILVCITFIYGIIRLNIPINVKNNMDVLLIQHNIDPWDAGRAAESIYIGQDLTERGLEESVNKPDLIVWSETAFRRPIVNEEDLYYTYPKEKPFFPFLEKLNSYFLTGAPHRQSKTEMTNSAVLLSPETEVIDYYSKIQLMPISEYIPFWEYKIVRDFLWATVGLVGTWAKGTRYTIFTISLKNKKTIKFSTPICFEDAFPDLCRIFIKEGADLFINLTNVSWSQRESAEIQMFVASKFRAIENRCMLLRSTNAGVTGIVDAYGHTLASLPLFEQGYLSFSVPIQKDKNLSIYTSLGDFFPVLLFIVIVLALIHQNILRLSL